ncbi:MAG: hypothetical protein ACTS4W_00520 [Candidatus Hodgkinia cicadicola]
MKECVNIRGNNATKAVLDVLEISDASVKPFGSTNSRNVIGTVFNAIENLHWLQRVWVH